MIAEGSLHKVVVKVAVGFRGVNGHAAGWKPLKTVAEAVQRFGGSPMPDSLVEKPARPANNYSGSWVVWMVYVPSSKKWTENGSSGKRRESCHRAGNGRQNGAVSVGEEVRGSLEKKRGWWPFLLTGSTSAARRHKSRHTPIRENLGNLGRILMGGSRGKCCYW